MSAMRKKTILEQFEERRKGSTDTSAYTEAPRKSTSISNDSIKNQVNNLYQTSNTSTSTNSMWDRVANRAKDIMNDTAKSVSNFTLGVSSSAKSSLSYMEDMSNNNSNNYKRYNQLIGKLNEDNKEQKERLNKNNTSGETIPLNIREQKLSNINNQKILLPQKEYKSPIQKTLDDSISKDEERIQTNIENSKTKIGKKVSELMPSIGQSTAGMVAGTINPSLGFSYFQTSAGGNYIREAKARGMNDSQSALYGTIMGAMEGVTESVGAKLTTDVGKAVFKNGAKEGLKAFGLDVAENFFEEAVMEPIQEAVMQATGGQSDWSNIGQRILESGINGALTSVIMGGASAGIGTATQLITKVQNGEQISQKEIAYTLKEINKNEEIDIEKILVNSFQFTAEDLMKNSDVQNKVNSKLENISEQISQSEAENIKRNL